MSAAERVVGGFGPARGPQAATGRRRSKARPERWPGSTDAGAGPPNPKGWAGIAEEARRRIRSGEWKRGETIPIEAALAREWNSSRVTVNRALRALADEGLLDRRRSARTRMVERPAAPYRPDSVEAAAQRAPPFVRDRLNLAFHARSYSSPA